MRRRALRVALVALLPAFGYTSTTASQTPPADVDGDIIAVAGVAPETVTIGDHFVVRIGVTAPAATAITFPRFTLIEPVEAVDSLRVERDSTGMWVATYRLTAWLPSDSLIARFPFRVANPDGSREDRLLRVRLPVVASVLPPDSSLHQPRPARAVLPIATPPTTGRGWLLPAILLLALFALAGVLALRGRRLRPVQPTDPRETALAALSAIEVEGLLEDGRADQYYVRTSRVLRQYLAAVFELGEDLTSSELLRLARERGLSTAAMDGLQSLLRSADRVKFSGDRAAAEPVSARAFAAGLRSWIEQWPRPDTGGEREVAA